MAANGMNPQGGAREGAGRVSDATRHRWQRILEESGAYDRVGRLLKNTKDDDLFLKALQVALDRAHGKAIQNIAGIDEKGNSVPCVVMLAPQQIGQAGGVDGK